LSTAGSPCPTVALGSENEIFSKPGTASVKVKAPATSSAEAALSSLKISPGTLSPAFSPNVTSYTAQVGASVDKLAVSASAKDSEGESPCRGGRRSGR